MNTRTRSTVRWMGVGIVAAWLAACGSAGGDAASSLDRNRGRVPQAAAADGAALYAANCAGCHGALASSSVAGASSASIMAAIAADRGGMGSISLAAADIDAIAAALGGSTGGGGGGGSDGAALYAANCAGCHGPLASSQVRGESAGDIREAIQENEGGMGSLVLTDAELQAIAGALGGSGGGGGGGHHDDGDDEGDDDGDDDGGGGGGGGGAGDGAALYTANCAGCHGALASSQVRGESAGDIREAIQENKGGMGALVLTDAELQAIAAALGGSGGGGGGSGGGGGGGGGGDDDRMMRLGTAHATAGRGALALR